MIKQKLQDNIFGLLNFGTAEEIETEIEEWEKWED
jgi:hypothetical protein